MLRITRRETPDGGCTLKLEGKLVESWVGELQAACEPASGSSVSLDLAGVSFVDAAGARVLAALIAGGASVVACSPFVGAMLHLEQQQGPVARMHISRRDDQRSSTGETECVP